MTSEQARNLLQRYRLGICTDEEVAALEAWIDERAENGAWGWTAAEREAYYSRLRDRLEVELELEERGPEGAVIRRMRRLWYPAVAAAVLVIVLSGWWLWRIQIRVPKPSLPASVAVSNVDSIKPPDIAKPTLVLSGGQHVLLESMQDGVVAKEGVADIKKRGESLDYRLGGGHDGATATLYNSLFNPRGSRIVHLILSDGTGVWLNAATTLRYPVAFGAERVVEVDGEAYFEVARDVARPFRVKKGEMEVQVLGTNFNVHAYSDEESVRITLLEGGVRVKTGGGVEVLSPGEAAVVAGGKIDRDPRADVAMALAWKNGLFDFNNSDIRDILRQMGRWYGIDVVYQGKVSVETYRGRISRELALGEVLKILELNNVRFKLEGKTLTVL